MIGGLWTWNKLWKIFKQVCKIGPCEEQNMDVLLHNFETCPFLGWMFIISMVNVHNLNYIALIQVCNPNMILNCVFFPGSNIRFFSQSNQKK